MSRSPMSALKLESLPQRGHLADQVARQLIRLIRDGALAPGDQLPSGAQLMENLKVSRSVVREAIARLESEGYVTSHQGKGVFVADWSRQQPFRLDGDRVSGLEELLALLELRREVEAGAAALAAERRSEHEVAQLRQCVRRMAEAGDEVQASEADAEFHALIAKATHNPYYRELGQYLDRQIRAAIALSHRHAAGRSADRALMLKEHKAILTAIEGRAAESARAVVQRHLSGVMERLRRSGGEA